MKIAVTIGDQPFIILFCNDTFTNYSNVLSPLY